MSSSNPYYIVQQGKINLLMKQKKEDRLALFKEIAGTKTYDQRRNESKKIMKETDTKRTNIESVIEVLQTKLDELEKESAEFKKYEVRTEERTQAGGGYDDPFSHCTPPHPLSLSHVCMCMSLGVRYCSSCFGVQHL